MRRARRTNIAPSLALVACWLTLLPVSCAAPSPTKTIKVLKPRNSAEHVVLADCRAGNGTNSSQMAYYTGTPNGTPVGAVAYVDAPPGESRQWDNQTTSGLFMDTHVTFTAHLGPQVADGDYAGTGNNGYVQFTCWEKYQWNLYIRDDVTCSQVYDCNHTPAPGKSCKPHTIISQ
jgi:hypothetical protein